jgi:hypothetical protein
MNPALKKKMEQIVNRSQTQMKSNLEYYHWLGKQVQEIMDHKDKYGGTSEISGTELNPVDKIAEAASLDKSAVYKAAQFYRSYSTQKELTRICGLRLKGTDSPLTWGHMIQLISVEDGEKRKVLEKETCDKGWTHIELRDALQKKFGRRRGGGRPVRVPKNFSKGMNEVNKMSELFLKKHDQAWDGDKFSIFTSIREMDPAKITPAHIEQIEEFVEGQNDMAEVAKDMAKQGEQCLRFAKKCVVDNAGSNGAPKKKVASRGGKNKPSTASKKKAPKKVAKKKVAAKRVTPKKKSKRKPVTV